MCPFYAFEQTHTCASGAFYRNLLHLSPNNVTRGNNLIPGSLARLCFISLRRFFHSNNRMWCHALMMIVIVNIRKFMHFLKLPFMKFLVHKIWINLRIFKNCNSRLTSRYIHFSTSNEFAELFLLIWCWAFSFFFLCCAVHVINNCVFL